MKMSEWSHKSSSSGPQQFPQGCIFHISCCVKPYHHTLAACSTLQRPLWLLLARLFTLHCTFHTVHCTLHTVHCIVYSLQCTLYTVHCIVYSLQCTLYTVQSQDWKKNTISSQLLLMLFPTVYGASLFLLPCQQLSNSYRPFPPLPLPSQTCPTFSIFLLCNWCCIITGQTYSTKWIYINYITDSV